MLGSSTRKIMTKGVDYRKSSNRPKGLKRTKRKTPTKKLVCPKKNPYVAEEKAEVMSLFLRTKLRKGEIIIDNSDETIAKELDISQGRVCYIINTHLKKSFDEAHERYLNTVVWKEKLTSTNSFVYPSEYD